MRARYRARMVVNLANGSTIAGVGVALAGGARLARGPQGLLTASGYRPPLPPAAFTMGNVIIVNRRRPGLASNAILAHETRHATQYAWCGGLLMLPLYFAAAGASWLLCGEFNAWNAFERQAGLADGGYADRALRRPLGRVVRSMGTRDGEEAGINNPSGQLARAVAPGSAAAGRESAGHGGSTASPSR